MEVKAAEQLQRWSEQEVRARAMNADAKEAAAEATERVQALAAQYRGLLEATFAVDDRLDWRGLMDLRPFQVPRPQWEDSQAAVGVPATRRAVEAFSRKARERRERAEVAAQEHYARAVESWGSQRARYEHEREWRNLEVEVFRRSYESGDPEAVEQYISLVLAASALPEGIDRETVVQYLADERALLVEATLPAVCDMRQIGRYRYVAARNATEHVPLPEKDRAELYDTMIAQLVVRTLHEIFDGDYGRHCDSVVLNGVVHDVERSTGRTRCAPILSVQATRAEFTSLDLGRVHPSACFRALKGVSGARFSDMRPVRPIRDLGTDDARFIEVGEVLGDLENDVNLMTLPWPDFEVLVRDLFEKMFAERGATVNVIRTERDDGVDAVAYDPDPVMGGKTAIRAERCRKIVPVAAVRELWGTVANESASKGLLVTTSRFGASAREFSRDKPLTLIDGPQLLHLMQNSGHRVRIDMAEQ